MSLFVLERLVIVLVSLVFVNITDGFDDCDDDDDCLSAGCDHVVPASVSV